MTMINLLPHTKSLARHAVRYFGNQYKDILIGEAIRIITAKGIVRKTFSSDDGIGPRHGTISRFVSWWNDQSPDGYRRMATTVVTLEDLTGSRRKTEFPVGFFLVQKGNMVILGFGLTKDRTKLDSGATTTKLVVSFWALSIHAEQLDAFFGPLEGISGDLIQSFIISMSYSQAYVYPSPTQSRKLSTVIMSPKTKDTIVSDLTTFYASRERYVAEGIPYRWVMVMQGTPGCGKTSLLRALATEFKRPLVTIPAGVLANKDTSLEDILRATPEGSIVALEDFPISMVRDRKLVPEDRRAEHERILSGFLNGFDGIHIPFGRVIILTMNDSLDEADPAFVRDERLSRVIVINPLTPEEVREFYVTRYGDDDLPDGIQFKSLSGSTLQKTLRNHPEKEDFLKAVIEPTII